MKRLLWILVVALWVALLATSLFARVEADDYCYAGEVQLHGLLGSVPYWYNAWSGSYSEHFTSSLFALAEPYGARIAVPAMLVAFALAWWYAFAHWYPRQDALLLALAFGAALALSRPNDEPIYWISGLVNYWVPLAGVGLLIGLLARRKTALAALVTFFAVAFSEVMAVLILAGLGLAFLAWKGERRRLLIVGAAGVIGFLITYVAPGNDLRTARTVIPELDTLDPLRLTISIFATNVVLTALWSLLPGLFLGGVGALLPPPFAVRRMPLMFLGLALGFALMLALLGMLTLAQALNPRSLFPLNVLWLAQWFFLGALVGTQLRAGRWLILAGAILLIPALQHVAARADYARLWDARHAQILAGETATQDIGSWDTLWNEAEGIVACAQAWYGQELHFIEGSIQPERYQSGAIPDGIATPPAPG